MSQTARVFSFDDLEFLHATLARFGVQGQEALATAELEIRRIHEGIKERLSFWQREVNRRQEEVNRCRADLAHKRALADGRRTGAADQEIALAKARQRLREAEEKVVVCRRWLVQIPDVIREYEGYARMLAGMLDANLKQSLALLQEKIYILKAYADLHPPSEEPAPAPAAPAAEAAPPPDAPPPAPPGDKP
jgi:hypothetical protein